MTSHSAQRGGALLILLVLLVMGGLTALLSGLNALQLRQQYRTEQALAQARDALRPLPREAGTTGRTSGPMTRTSA